MPLDAYRQMLDLIVAQVVGLVTTADRVHETPAAALAAEKFPSICVEGVSDEIAEVFESADGDEHLERHRLTVSIHSLATSLEDRDKSASDVKKALLGPFAAHIGYSRRFVRSDFAQRGDGERPLYAASQQFAFEYHVTATAPDVLIHPDQD